MVFTNFFFILVSATEGHNDLSTLNGKKKKLEAKEGRRVEQISLWILISILLYVRTIIKPVSKGTFSSDTEKTKSECQRAEETYGQKVNNLPNTFEQGH